MPSKIMTEMKKAEEMHGNLKSLHNICLHVNAAMAMSQLGTASKYDLAQDVAKLNSRIDSKLDHLQQLLHPIKNAIESMQQGLVPMEMDLKHLKKCSRNILVAQKYCTPRSLPMLQL